MIDAKRESGGGDLRVMGSSSMNLFSHWPPPSDSSGPSTAFQIVNSAGPIFDTADAPDDGSQASAPAPFLTKTYDMVDDPATDAVVSWSSSGKSFVVWNPPEFSRDLLPNYFKHNNFSSFVRQLNTYGFRKVDPEKWEFANDGFLQGKRQFLKNIHRRKPASHSHSQIHQGQGSSVGACVEVGKFGLEREVERLKRDKNVLMMELVRLRQQQQQTERELQLMGQRYHDREQRQQKMISFFARAIKNPSFFSQLVEQNERFSTTRKKRKFSSNDENESESSEPESTTGFQMVRYQPNANAIGSMMFSNALDSAGTCSKRDTLDLMVDEKRQESDESPQSGVSLVEMHTSSSGAEEVLDCKLSNFSKKSLLNLPSVSALNSSDARKEKSTLLLDDSLDTGGLLESIELSLATRGGGNLSPKGRPTEKTPKSEDVTAVAGNTVVRPINDVFWEQFLSGTPASYSPGTKVDANASEVGFR